MTEPKVEPKKPNCYDKYLLAFLLVVLAVSWIGFGWSMAGAKQRKTLSERQGEMSEGYFEMKCGCSMGCTAPPHSRLFDLPYNGGVLIPCAYLTEDWGEIK